MKIIRCEDNSGETRYGCQHPDGAVTRIDGCLFGDFADSGEPLQVNKLLAPVAPAAIRPWAH